MSNHDNVSPLEISTPIAVFPEESNLVNVYDNEFKTEITSMFK